MSLVSSFFCLYAKLFTLQANVAQDAYICSTTVLNSLTTVDDGKDWFPWPNKLVSNSSIFTVLYLEYVTLVLYSGRLPQPTTFESLRKAACYHLVGSSFSWDI